MPALTHNRVKGKIDGGNRKNNSSSSNKRVNHAIANKNMKDSIPSGIGKSNTVKQAIDYRSKCLWTKDA